MWARVGAAEGSRKGDGRAKGHYIFWVAALGLADIGVPSRIEADKTPGPSPGPAPAPAPAPDRDPGLSMATFPCDQPLDSSREGKRAHSGRRWERGGQWGAGEAEDAVVVNKEERGKRARETNTPKIKSLEDRPRSSSIAWPAGARRSFRPSAFKTGPAPASSPASLGVPGALLGHRPRLQTTALSSVSAFSLCLGYNSFAPGP